MKAELSKFGRVEIAMRRVLRGYSNTLTEIDRAASAKARTAEEAALLGAIRQEWVEAQKQAMNTLEHLFDEVDLHEPR